MAKKRKVPDTMIALGSVERFQWNPGDKFLTITVKCGHAVRRMKWDKSGDGKLVLIRPKDGYVTWRVPELSDFEISQLELLGTAHGADFYHCLYIARKHSGEDFLENLYGYKIGSSKEKDYAMSVSFYCIPGIRRRR